MKTVFKICWLVLLLIVILKLSAQELSPDSISSLIRTNYVVPDLPAFNALGQQPLNLLRPSTAKEFSISANEFYDGKNIIIPKSFAIEFSPLAIVKNNRLTLSDYQKNIGLYNARISFGSYRDSLSISRLAIGIRTTLIDEADPKNDHNLVEIYKQLSETKNLRVYYYNKKKEEYIAKNINFIDVELREKSFEEFDSIAKMMNEDFIALKQEYYLDRVKTEIPTYSDNKKWNARRLDVAAAILCNSPDSIMKNIRFEALRGWLTYAVPVTESGQLITAFNVGCNVVDNKMNWSICVPARFYFGNNNIKGLVEGQLYFNQIPSQNNFTLNAGCEYRLNDNIWLNFTVGIKNDLVTSNSELISDFKLVYGI